MIKIWIMALIFLLIGCSKKASNLVLKSNVTPVNIAKSGNFLFYVYIKNGNKITRISKRKLQPLEDEEIIRVYQSSILSMKGQYSYYPSFDLRYTNENHTLECGSIFDVKKSSYKELNPIFCKSSYTENYNIAGDVAFHVLVSVLTLGVGAVIVGNGHRKIFNTNKFKMAIVDSQLLQVVKMIKEKNIEKISVLNRISLEPTKKSKISISNNLRHQNNQFLVFDDRDDFKGIVDIGDLKKKNVFQAVSILTERLIALYITSKSLIAVVPPSQIRKPKLPQKRKLIKSEFETKEMFEIRVKEAMQQREKQIMQLQERFRIAVEVRNKKVEKLKQFYQNNLEKIEQKYEKKQKNLAQYIPYFTSIALQYIVGNLNIKNLRYDAEKGLMYADLYASNPNYYKKIYLKIPLNRAESFKNKQNYQPIITYRYNDNKLILSDILVDDYHAKLSEIDYKPKNIAVELQDKKIDINLVQNSFKLQNPNLKEHYSVEGISYSEGVASSITRFQDDLPQLLGNINQHPQDNTKWLFVIGAEKYDNTDEVRYSKRSAEIFTEVAQKTLGITDRNSYKLIGNRATSGGIEDKLKLMLQNVKEGDSIYFYYSGHGIPVLPNRIPYLLPKDKVPDFINQTPFFKLSNIYKLLANSKASKIIAIMDSCFSGSTDGRSVFRGVAGSVLVPKRVVFNHNKMVVFTAGREKQFSNMYPQRGHRLFSYFVMKALLEGKRDIREIYNEVFSNVQSVSNGFGDLKRQEPTIEGNKKLKF